MGAPGYVRRVSVGRLDTLYVVLFDNSGTGSTDNATVFNSCVSAHEYKEQIEQMEHISNVRLLSGSVHDSCTD